jgi:hypothetical protein
MEGELWVAYAIIILIVVVALAPLWHFVPSKRQRHQAKLREAAALAGLFVEFRDLPLPPNRLERMPASERQVLYYGCRLPPARKEPRQRQSWVRKADGWESQPARAEAPAILAQMPQSVLALGVSQDSCGLFWREDGDENQVRELAARLQQWRESLSTP